MIVITVIIIIIIIIKVGGDFVEVGGRWRDAKGIIPGGILRGHIIAHVATTHCIQQQYANNFIMKCFVTCSGCCGVVITPLKVARNMTRCCKIV